MPEYWLLLVAATGACFGVAWWVVVPLTSPCVRLERTEREVRLSNKLVLAGRRQPPQAVTVSVGVAMAGDATGDLESLLAAADGARYRAKANGRNRVQPADGARTAAMQANRLFPT
jgi:predicted signal transduction protein with EAL and GGDEF domain